jgi:hypothetical protein
LHFKPQQVQLQTGFSRLFPNIKPQCRINHMAEAAYATGPALLGAPRLLSSIISEFFCSLFQRGAPKNPSPPENVRPQNLKSKAPKSGAQNGFSPVSVFQRFQCFSVSARSPKVPGICQAPRFKN